MPLVTLLHCAAGAELLRTAEVILSVDDCRGVNTIGARVNILCERTLIIHGRLIVYDDVSGCLPINNNIPCRIDTI